jgi:hypothetical protein
VMDAQEALCCIDCGAPAPGMDRLRGAPTCLEHRSYLSPRQRRLLSQNVQRLICNQERRLRSEALLYAAALTLSRAQALQHDHAASPRA